MAFTGRIREIWAEFAGEHHTIWKDGAMQPTVKIPVDATWHLHVNTEASWPEVAPWATAITGRNGVIFGNARRCMGGGCDYEFEFSGFPTLTAGQTFDIGRIRFWKNRAYTNVPPPEVDR